MKSLFTFILVLAFGLASIAQDTKTPENTKDAPKVKSEFENAEKVALPKTQPASDNVESATAKKAKLEKLPIGQIKKKDEATANASALLGKAYRIENMEFGEKELANNAKLALVKEEDVIHTSYPSLEFLPESNIAFCYNQPVVVYHGDEEEFKKLNTTMKVCKDGKWSENNNNLQLSFNLENKNKRINYNISELKEETLVMEKKASHVF